jgi:hypothetical protein
VGQIGDLIRLVSGSVLTAAIGFFRFEPGGQFTGGGQAHSSRAWHQVQRWPVWNMAWPADASSGHIFSAAKMLVSLNALRRGSLAAACDLF